MQVTRIYESPRVTKPYTEEQWAEVLALGERSTSELQAGDVRLTMGGEPTFVATDRPRRGRMEHRRAGPHQARLRHRAGAQAARRIRRRRLPAFRPGQVVPGEQLPRWALSIYWRADGQPMLAQPGAVRRRAPTRATPAPTRSASCSAGRQAGPGHRLHPAGYEDVFYYLWRERKLPVNVDPFDSRLDDELERERLRRVFDAEAGFGGRLCAAAAANGSSSSKETPAALAGRPEAGPPAPGSSATTACT
jgi:uncharacterized protein (DUF2126 family)